MDDQRPTSAPAGRDVAAAWLLCVLLGALALGLMSNLHEVLPLAAMVSIPLKKSGLK